MIVSYIRVSNRGKYDPDILIKLNLRTSKVHVVDMQDKFGVLASNDTRFTMLVERSR